MGTRDAEVPGARSLEDSDSEVTRFIDPGSRLEPGAPRAVLFAFIKVKKGLFDDPNNAVARDIVAGCETLLGDAASKSDGTQVKRVESGLVCAFKDVASAVSVASDVQLELETALKSTSLPPDSVHLSIGLQLGPVIQENDRFFGDAVNESGRMAKTAKPGQILTTKHTVDALPAMLRKVTRFVDEAQVSDKGGKSSVYEVLWQVDDETALMGHGQAGVPEAEDESAQKLVLAMGDQRFEVSTERPVVTLGRTGSSDIMVQGKSVSRLHARIEYREGHFVLIDQSSNGTFLVSRDGTLTIRGEEYVLAGSGAISLGQSPEVNPGELIHFACV